jgi:hypothetical protein
MVRRLFPLVGLVLLTACGWAAPGPPAQTVGPADPAVEPSVGPVLERPIPYPIDVADGYEAAVAAGTRTATGQPGPRYWQQGADYRLTAHRAAPEPGRDR